MSHLCQYSDAFRDFCVDILCMLFQLNLLSIRTPRYFIWSFSFKEILSILMSRIESIFFLFEIVGKLDLSTLSDNLLTESHVETFLNSRLAMELRFFGLSLERKMLVSSANRWILRILEYEGRS